MNSKAFSPDEVSKGLHIDLLKCLIDYNSKSDECYNDIHIYTDGYCTIIEWCEVDYDEKYNNKRFKLVEDK